MSALDDLLNKSRSQVTDLDWAVISLEPNTITVERAAEELAALRKENELLKNLLQNGAHFV